MPHSSRGKAGKIPAQGSASSGLSVVRTAVAAGVAVVGIAWIVVYQTTAQGGGQGFLAGLGRWNYLIGFLLLFLGLALAANPRTPLGRGRGVVVGMLGCFLVGLVWIVLYYIFGQASLPLLSDLGQYNLVVGIGFMAVGFVYATRWE